MRRLFYDQRGIVESFSEYLDDNHFRTINRLDDIADEIVKIPSTESFFEPMLSIIPAQLFAYYCAVHRGNNPDKPRNLAKSVTVE